MKVAMTQQQQYDEYVMLAKMRRNKGDEATAKTYDELAELIKRSMERNQR